MNILVVAVGGAIGAVLRYGISQITPVMSFPLATFIINIVGAFIIGLVVGLAERENLPDSAVLFLKTGFCGGFTTFSTFSLESVELLSSGKYMIGGTYMVLSLACCLTGVILGKLCVK